MVRIQLNGAAAATIARITAVSRAVPTKIVGRSTRRIERYMNIPTTSEYAAATPAISVAVNTPARNPTMMITGIRRASDEYLNSLQRAEAEKAPAGLKSRVLARIAMVAMMQPAMTR